jgi:hypothetical protein
MHRNPSASRPGNASSWRLVSIALLALWAAGCSSPAPGKPGPGAADLGAFAPPTELTATLVDPVDIELKWRDNATEAAGYFVEYSPNANNEFVVIDALPPHSTHYRHPRLLPETRFVYRVRPFFGKASNVAEVTTGKSGPQQSPDPAILRETPGAQPVIRKSIRSSLTAVEVAPTDLRATLIPPAGVRLTWKNHASDADGCLLEIKPQWDKNFQISAFLAATNTSLNTYNLPFESRFSFRVRAFYYGQPSNLAEQTTGRAPTASLPLAR